MLEAIGNSPNSPRVLSGIPQLWSDVTCLTHQDAYSAVDLRVRRMLIMHSHYASNNWLETIIHKASSRISSLLKQPYEQCNWIERLICDIHNAMASSSSKRQRSFSSGAYLPDIPSVSTSIPLGRRSTDPKTIKERARSGCRTLLKTWLNFPLDPADERRYDITKFLRQFSSHHAIFLLDNTWQLFINADVVVGKSESIYNGLSTALESHPLNNPESTESTFLKHLQNLFVQWGEWLKPASHLKKSPQSNPDTPNVPITSEIAKIRHQFFIHWLRQILPVLHSNPEDENSVSVQLTDSGNPLQKKVCSNPDFYLPFRERAPTRQKAIKADYSSAESLRTKEGFWNLLCHRGVFFGSKFAEERESTYFKDLDAWKEFYKSSNKSDAYFCNMNAYGTSISQRTLYLMEEYWQAADHWVAYLAKPENKVDFDSIYIFLMATEKNKNINHPLPPGHSNRRNKNSSPPKYDAENRELDERTKVQRFHGIGSLIAMLIAGDLAAAGVYNMPTPEEMGKHICNLDKGAQNGLLKLGLISDKSKSDVEAAVVEVCKYLDEHLSEAEKKVMGYSPIMVEHALCKYSRLLPKPQKQQVGSTFKMKASKKKKKTQRSDTEDT